MPLGQNKGLSQEMKPKSIPSHACATSDSATYQRPAVTDKGGSQLRTQGLGRSAKCYSMVGTLSALSKHASA